MDVFISPLETTKILVIEDLKLNFLALRRLFYFIQICAIACLSSAIGEKSTYQHFSHDLFGN